MRVRSLLLFVSLVLALVSQLAVAQDSAPKGGGYVTFPSVGVEMKRPNGFTVAERFVGFGLEEELASILIVSLPGAYEELAAGMTEARFAKKGVLVAKREQIQVSGRDATLLHARQRSPELDFTKWLLLLDGGTSTKLITATVPTPTATFLGKTMTVSLLSTRVVATTYVPPDVGFTLTPSKMLKPRTELAGVGKVLAYVGSGPPKAPGTPQFIATPSVGAFEGPDREQFAVDRAMALATIGEISLQSTGPVRIDGLEGYEVIAKGKDLKTKVPLVIYQVMLFEPDGNYYLMVGIVEKKRAAKLMPAFKATAKSFKRTK